MSHNRKRGGGPRTGPLRAGQAIIPRGYPSMIVGGHRLLFRVVNVKNAGIGGTWVRIHPNNRDALELVQKIWLANRLEPLTVPWE